MEWGDSCIPALQTTAGCFPPCIGDGEGRTGSPYPNKATPGPTYSTAPIYSAGWSARLRRHARSSPPINGVGGVEEEGQRLGEDEGEIAPYGCGSGRKGMP